MSIPKVIHYCWFGGKELPKSAVKCINSWRKYCPDFEIIEHNESNYDFSKNRYMKEAYEAKKWAFVSDVARLDILYHDGGIYFDTDVELIKPIEDYLDCEGFMGFEDNKKVASGLGIGAVAGNEIIKFMLEDYENLLFICDGKADITPCPVRNTNTLVNKIGLKPDGTYQEIEGFRFYPRDYFSPKESVAGKMLYKTENTVSIHHYDASWESQEFHLRKKIYKAFGRRIGKIVYSVVKIFYGGSQS